MQRISLTADETQFPYSEILSIQRLRRQDDDSQALAGCFLSIPNLN